MVEQAAIPCHGIGVNRVLDWKESSRGREDRALRGSLGAARALGTSP